MKNDFQLITRAGCHLCMDMEARLEIFADDHPIDYTILDVDKHPTLLSLYTNDVPVLLKGEALVCKHFFDETALTKVLQ